MIISRDIIGQVKKYNPAFDHYSISFPVIEFIIFLSPIVLSKWLLPLLVLWPILKLFKLYFLLNLYLAAHTL